MAKTVTATFELRGEQANYGKLVLDITNTSGETPDDICDVYVKVENGYEVKPYGSSPDISDLALDASEEVTVALPVVNGTFLGGSYTITVKFVDYNDAGSFVEQSVTYDLCPLVGNTITPAVTYAVDCQAGLLVVNDATNYGSDEGSTSNLAITIDHPNIPNVGDIANTVFNSDQAVVQFDYANVDYVATLEFDVSTTQAESDGITVQVLETGSVQQTIHVECEDCGLSKCVRDTVASIRSKAALRGGIANLDASERNLYYELPTLFSLLEMSKACQDTDGIDNYRAQIKALVGQCGCVPDNSPVKFTPAISIASLNLNSDNSITGDGLSDSPFELVNDEDAPGAEKYYGTDALGAKGYHDLPAGGGGGSAVVVDWTEPTLLSFFDIEVAGSHGGLKYRVLTDHIEFAGEFSSNSPTGAFTAKIIANASLVASAQDGRQGSPVIPIYRSNGTTNHVNCGYIWRSSSDGDYYITTTSDFAASERVVVSGSIARV